MSTEPSDFERTVLEIVHDLQRTRGFRPVPRDLVDVEVALAGHWIKGADLDGALGELTTTWGYLSEAAGRYKLDNREYTSADGRVVKVECVSLAGVNPPYRWQVLVDGNIMAGRDGHGIAKMPAFLITPAGMAAVVESVRPQKARGPKRRRKGKRTERPLTEKQAEALQMYGECKGNISEIARTLGISRQATLDRVKAGHRKLGVSWTYMKAKTRTQKLSEGGRGETLLADEDDRRMD